MAVLAFVGDNAKSCQVWPGGSPVLTHTAQPTTAKTDVDHLEKTVEPILAMFVQERKKFEAFDCMSPELIILC